METTSNPTVSLFGIDFDLTVLAMSLLTVIIVFGVVFWSSRKMTIKPKGKQNVLEFIYEFVNNTISQKFALVCNFHLCFYSKQLRSACIC